MFGTQLAFFAPLAVAAVILALFPAMNIARYAGAALAALFIAGVLLYVVMLVITPREALLHLPTLVAAYAVPVVLIAGVLRIPGRLWLRESRVLVGLGCAVVASVFAPLLLLVAACIVQSNCL